MERQLFSQNGVCHLILEEELPDMSEGEAGARIDRIAGRISAIVRARAEAALPLLAARYDRDESPQKHLRHRPLLLSLSLSLGNEGRLLSLSLSLSRCGRLLWETKKAARLDKASGRFLCKEEVQGKPKGRRE